MSYWRDKSIAVIEAAIKEAELLGLEGKEIEKHVAKAYPFGERQNHPYQMWLKVVSETFNRKPIRKLRAAEDAAIQHDQNSGQGRMF